MSPSRVSVAWSVPCLSREKESPFLNVFDHVKSFIKSRVGARLLDSNRRELGTFFEFERDRLSPRYWSCETNPAGHLTVGGIDLVEVARTHQTPLQVIHAQGLPTNYAVFVGVFG